MIILKCLLSTIIMIIRTFIYLANTFLSQSSYTWRWTEKTLANQWIDGITMYTFSKRIFQRPNLLSPLPLHQCLNVFIQLPSHVQPSATPWTAARQASLSFTISLFINSSPLNQWCHPTFLSSVTPFSSCPQSFPASGSFPVNWLFASGGRSIGASASASMLPMTIQGQYPLGLTGLISLLSKGLSRVFYSTQFESNV